MFIVNLHNLWKNWFAINFRADRATESSSRILAPMAGKAFISGVQKRQVLVLPFNFQITYDSATMEFTIEVNPNDQSTVCNKGIFLYYKINMHTHIDQTAFPCQWYKSYTDVRERFDTMFLDFARTFDKVDHVLLLGKVDKKNT